jgi:Putative zinc-finger
MTNQDQNYDQWQPVPKGTLAKYASRNARKSTYRRLAAGIGIAAMALLAVYVFDPSPPTTSRPGEPNYGGITCSQVRLNLSAYKSASLDASTRSRIDEHLRQCSICQQLVARSQRSAVSNSSLALTIPSRRF